MKKLLRFLMLAVLFLPFALQAQNTLTVADGTTTNSNVPIYGNWADAYLRCQTIYPATTLEAAATGFSMNGGSITSLTYYLSSPAAAPWTGTWEVKLMEVTDNTLSAFVDMTDATTVYTGALDGTSSTLTIPFTTPYTYNGGNLLIEVSETTKGNYKTASFYGVSATGASWQGYNSTAWANITGSAQNFIPKTTFTFTGGTEISCSPVQSLTIDAEQTTSSSLTLTWSDELNSGATYTVYNMADNTSIEDGISGTTYTVTGLDANTLYTFGVEANCSPTDASVVMSTSGRTSCAVEALPYSETFDVSLNSDPCWRGATNVTAEEALAGTALTLTANSQWTYSSSASNGLEAGHYRVNIFGTSCKKWMITPEIDLTEVSSPLLSFDAAFTAYSGTGAATGFESNDSQAFMILVTTDGGQTWALASNISLATIANSSYITQYVDLSEFAGETVRIAFYAQSTVSGGDNNLHVDNITIEESTGEICYPVTSLVASEITANSATLTWEGEANSYTIYNMSDSTEIGYTTELTYPLEDLNANTQYTFGVQAICNTSESPIVTVNLRTNCAAEALPYSETFDVSLNSDPCWRGASGVTADEALAGTALTLTANSQWTYSSAASNGLEAGHYRVNIYGTTCKKWMITPEIDLSEASNPLLTFDAAFTLYSGEGPATGFEGNDSQAFKVLVTTDGGQTWSLASDISLTSIASSAYLPQYVSLSEYVGETVRVAFYAQSTVSGGDNNLHIDNILIEESTSEICYAPTSLAVSGITAHGATLTWEGDADSYNIYVMPDTTFYANTSDTEYTFEGLDPMTSYTFGVASSCGNDESSIVTKSFTTLVSCVAPTNVAVALTPGDGSVATVNWTDTLGAAWQLCLNGDTTDLYDADETSFSFDGLTPEQPYTVMVRTNCSADGEGFSAWTSVVNFTPTDAYSITVNEGTTTNSYVPIYGLYVDEITKSQFIIPATDLTAMQFGNINKLTFYASTASAPWNGASFNVYLTETNETTVETLADYDGMTQVYAGSLSIVDNKMVVNFTTPYTYMGGNLMIGFLQTVSGSYASSYWYGVTATGASQGGYGTSVSQRNFLPKTTINYAPGEEPDCLPVNGLAVVDSTITTEGATLTWNGDADSYNVYVINGTDTTFEQNVSETTATLTGLTAMTSYTYGVRAVCGTNESDIRTVNFVTACAAVELPYTETFEATSGARGCWTTDGDNKWSISTGDYSASTGAFEGSFNAKAIASDRVSVSKLISPELNLNGATGINLTFAHIQRSWSGDVDALTIYYRTSATDSWTMAAEYTDAVPTWTVENLILPAAYQVAFEFASDYGYGVGLDSVVFAPMTEDFCFAPTNLAVSGITTDGATLTWNGDADSYNVYVINGTDTTLAEQNVSENTLALTGLTAMTSYTYGVTSVCTNGESEMVSVTFTTACTAVELPYTETFEATSGTRDCWNLVSNNTANVGGTYGMGFVTVDNREVLRFSSYNSASDYNQYGFSPLMEVSSDAANLMVNVVYATYGSTDELYFGYITDTDTIWDPTPYSTDNNSSASNWQTYTAVIPATATQLAIHYYGNYKYYAWIDSVSVTEMTSDYCYAVTDLTVDSTTASSVSLSWTDNNNTGITYTVYNGTEVVATNVTGTSYVVNGLTAATDYTFGVVANCSAESSSDMVTVNVMTDCNDVTTLPYYEGFENGLGCWTTINGSSSNGMPWGIINNVDYAHSGSKAAASFSYYNYSALNADAWLISPKFVLPTTDSLTFTWWEIADPQWQDSYSVVLSTTTNDTAAFTTVLRPYDTASGEWAMQTVNLTPFAGQSVYIAFHHVDYNENYLIIDDIALNEGGYVPPAPDTLTVTFAVNDATMGTTVPAPGTYQYISGDTVSFHPEANTGYHFTNWVMEANGQSQSLAPTYVSVYFLADAFMSYGSVTLTALFEADSTPVVTTYTVTLSTADATMGTVNLPGENTVVANNQFTAQATANEGYHFVAWTSNNATVSTANPYTFTVTADIALTATFEADSTPVVTTYTVTLSTADATMGTVNLPGENTVVANNQFTAQATANEGYHFVAWTSNNATVSTANPYTFTVTADIALTATFEADSTPVVVCNTPTGLHYTAIENHAIAIAWDADANVNSWNIRYRMSGNGAWNNATSNTNSYTISGLQGLTSYDIEVQANCGDGNVSEWCEAITVQTTNVGIVNHLENSVVLFPNPAREYVDIRIDGEFNVSSMEVYDVYGKLINNINVVDNPTRIYVSNLSNGMYFVRVTTDAGVVTKTFVKK